MFSHHEPRNDNHHADDHARPLHAAASGENKQKPPTEVAVNASQWDCWWQNGFGKVAAFACIGGLLAIVGMEKIAGAKAGAVGNGSLRATDGVVSAIASGESWIDARHVDSNGWDGDGSVQRWNDWVWGANSPAADGSRAQADWKHWTLEFRAFGEWISANRPDLAAKWNAAADWLKKNTPDSDEEWNGSWNERFEKQIDSELRDEWNAWIKAAVERWSAWAE